ncbi:MAG: helix-turn-helix transcriptional regulator [Chlamydiales bacterium]|nr:helix-turn-helix transcriptional regulator [Chlamydiales bacterium]
MTIQDEKKEAFGRRLRKLRKAVGLTQIELAQELGVSRRIIDYYEREGRKPAAHLLANLAKTLNVTVDELLGIAPPKRETPKLGARLERRLRQIEKMSPKAKKQILQLLDTFIEAEQLKKK